MAFQPFSQPADHGDGYFTSRAWTNIIHSYNTIHWWFQTESGRSMDKRLQWWHGGGMEKLLWTVPCPSLTINQTTNLLAIIHLILPIPIQPSCLHHTRTNQPPPGTVNERSSQSSVPLPPVRLLIFNLSGRRGGVAQKGKGAWKAIVPSPSSILLPHSFHYIFNSSSHIYYTHQCCM